jgi:hypothetical protein
MTVSVSDTVLNNPIHPGTCADFCSKSAISNFLSRSVVSGYFCVLGCEDDATDCIGFGYCALIRNCVFRGAVAEDQLREGESPNHLM